VVPLHETPTNFQGALSIEIDARLKIFAIRSYKGRVEAGEESSAAP